MEDMAVERVDDDPSTLPLYWFKKEPQKDFFDRSAERFAAY